MPIKPVYPLSRECAQDYYDWRIKNGVPDNNTKRKIFEAGWIAGRKAYSQFNLVKEPLDKPA